VGEGGWSCIHGGCTCTIVVLVDSMVYVSNVGDSTAMLVAPLPKLTEDMLKQEVDVARDVGMGMDLSFTHTNAQGDGAATPTPSSYLLLTAEHSPESVYEYQRMCAYSHTQTQAQASPHTHTHTPSLDPSHNHTQTPLLCVVYDSPAHDKSQCAPVFASPHTQSDPLAPSERGRYDMDMCVWVWVWVWIMDMGVCYTNQHPPSTVATTRTCGGSGRV
ncbi:hypothetical protein EON64_19355, partial [archaeon]